MMTKPKIYFVIIYLLACSYLNNLAAQVTANTEDPKTKATVIFIRTANQYNSANVFNVIVDDSATIKLVSNSYYPMLISPGTIKFRHNRSKVNAEYDVEAGKTYYIRAIYIPGVWKVRAELMVMDAVSGKSILNGYSPKDLRKPLLRPMSRVGAQFGFGGGFNGIPIITTTDGQDSKIDFGGGAGVGIQLGRELHKYFDLGFGYKYQSGGLSLNIKDAKMNFNRHIISATPSLIIPIQGGYSQRIKLGVGADVYLGNKLVIETAKIPGGINDKWKYKEAIGYHVSLMWELNMNENISLFYLVQYYNVSYNFSSGQTYYPTTKEFNNPNGSGFQLGVGINWHFW